VQTVLLINTKVKIVIAVLTCMVTTQLVMYVKTTSMLYQTVPHVPHYSQDIQTVILVQTIDTLVQHVIPVHHHSQTIQLVTNVLITNTLV